jgi:hypothetical protein
LKTKSQHKLYNCLAIICGIILLLSVSTPIHASPAVGAPTSASISDPDLQAAFEAYAASQAQRNFQLVADAAIIDGDWARLAVQLKVDAAPAATPGGADVLLARKISGKWQIIGMDDRQWSGWVDSAPSSILDADSRSYLQDLAAPTIVPQSPGSVLIPSLKLPWPAGRSRCISGYGYGQVTHINKEKYALDFGLTYEEVAAVAGGTVSRIVTGLGNTYPNQVIYGNLVEIDHGGGLHSLYAHLSEVYVSVGQSVGQGKVVGKSGNSGYSTGPHMHFFIANTAAVLPEPMSGYTGFVGFSCKQGTYYLSDNQASGQACSAVGNGLPRDNTTFNNNQITFTWSPPACDGLDYYTFRVATHADIDNGPWLIDHGVSKDATSTTETINGASNGQTLYWAIWPHNSSGYGPKSGPNAFKIDTSVPPTPPPLPAGSWNVQYFRNKELNDQCNSASFDRTFIFSDWGDSAPASNCNSDNWSARFTRRVTFQGGSYNFALEADDWGRIYVDNVLFVDKWNGASQHYEGHYVNSGDHDVRVEFADTLGGAKISAWWWGPGFEVPHDTQDPSQWFANYWINPTQYWDAYANVNEGSGQLNHEWSGGSPGWDMPSDNFSAKFRRTVNFECGLYRFIFNHDDGMKFWIDNTLQVDRWSGAIGYYTIDLPVARGPHDLQIDYVENGGSAHISFDWQQLNGCSPAAPTLTAPFNSASFTWDTAPTFAWSPVSGATQYYVRLLGSDGVDINSDWITAAQYNFGRLRSGNYTWTVISRNDYGSSSASSPRSFSVQQAPPEVPALTFTYLPIARKGSPPVLVTIPAHSADVEIGNINCISWSMCHDTTYANFLLTGYAQATVAASKDSGIGPYTLKRVFLFFDTSQIPANATITNVELVVYIGAYVHGSGIIYAVNSTAPIPVANGNFGNATFSGAALGFTPAANTWADIQFSETARSWVTRAGMSRFALVQEADLFNNAPSTVVDALISLAEDGGHAPYLVVTYTQ